MEKGSVTLGGVALAGNAPINWKFQTGTQPHITTVSVHESVWERLQDKVGQPLTLQIVDSRGVRTQIEKLTILHRVPSQGPRRVTFLLSDLRWKWSYALVVRDYNIAKKTGKRNSLGFNVPVEGLVSVDEYEYRRSSLTRDGFRWTAKEIIQDVLKEVTGEDSGEGTWVIDSFPIEDTGTGGRQDGQLSIQNVSLRDAGDAALARALAYAPGADLWVDATGTVRVIDGTDLDASDAHLETLKPATWDGEAAALIDRNAIRPARVVVHYQREVECLFQMSQDMGDTVSEPLERYPFFENVIPTVDPATAVEGIGDVPAGTWLEASLWLRTMDAIRPSGVPWTWENIAPHWLVGDIEGVLGASGEADVSANANISARIEAFKQHFRQTYRINERYMGRISDLKDVRAAMLDPVTATRAPAAVWGEACIVHSDKGLRMAHRTDDERMHEWLNVSQVPAVPFGGQSFQDQPAAPAKVSILDRDAGIFRVDWITSIYGSQARYLPGHTVDQNNQPSVPTRDLSKQDRRPIGAGIRVQGGSNGIYWARTFQLYVLMTIVPAAPNNERQCHREYVRAADVAELFRTEYRIQNGAGPDLNVWVAPSEATARFGWGRNDSLARETIIRLLGLDSTDPESAGIDGPELPGFAMVNTEPLQDASSELGQHAQAVAAEMLAPFADARQGRVATIMQSDENGDGKIELIGNMASVQIGVAAAPSGKVGMLHDFAGMQRPLSRLAMLPESVRHLLLGTLTVGIRP